MSPGGTSEAEHTAAWSGARVGAFESCPGRFVFIEEGNTEAWIATDCSVTPEV